MTSTKRLALLCCVIAVSACTHQNTDDTSSVSVDWTVIDNFESDSKVLEATVIPKEVKDNIALMFIFKKNKIKSALLFRTTRKKMRWS